MNRSPGRPPSPKSEDNGLISDADVGYVGDLEGKCRRARGRSVLVEVRFGPVRRSSGMGTTTGYRPVSTSGKSPWLTAMER